MLLSTCGTDEELDKFSKTFSSMVETAKDKLTNKIREISVQSTSTDLSKLYKQISTSFGVLTSHLSASFDESKMGKGRKKPAGSHLRTFWQQLILTVKNWKLMF